MLPGGLLIAREIMNSGKVKRRVLSRRLRSFLFDCRQHGVMAYVLSQVSAFFLHSKRLPVVFFSANDWFARFLRSVYVIIWTCRLQNLRYTKRERSGISLHVIGDLKLFCLETRKLVLVIPFPPCFPWLLFSKICHVVRWFDPGCE